VCEADPCGKACPFGQTCNDATGKCIDNPCASRDCADGQWCNPNSRLCEVDPCKLNNITCPGEDEVCLGGTCVDKDSTLPDAAGEAHVTVGGGGGCSTTGGASSLLIGLALLLVRRRRQPTSAKREGGAQ
jgi:MYXO-CTERM domain-containing protein